MGRTHYLDTVAVAAQTDGDLDAAAGVQVDVFLRGTNTRAQVYTTQSGGTAKANPHTTDITGLVSFWANFGSYDVQYTDTNAPPRFGSYTVGWDSIPYVDVSSTLPPAVIVPTARRTAPAGWLMCDGSAVSRTTYAALWDALRTDASGNLTGSSPFGNGDGSTTFNTPDLRGRAPVGVDGSGGRLTADDAIGQSGGADKHTLATSELPSHSHGVTDPGHSHTIDPNYARTAAEGQNTTNSGPLAFGTQTFQIGLAGTGVTIQAAGGGGAHNNMQPYLVVNYMIKT